MLSTRLGSTRRSGSCTGTDGGRPSLALDLIEEFRPITVDVAVWRCVAVRSIRPEQFQTESERGCRMAPDTPHTFLAAYEKRMTPPGAPTRSPRPGQTSIIRRSQCRTRSISSDVSRPSDWSPRMRPVEIAVMSSVRAKLGSRSPESWEPTGTW